MYNRYKGNSGKAQRMEDSIPAPKVSRQAPRPVPAPKRPQGIVQSITRLLPAAAADIDTEDILLILILYLMYRESGDKDLLIMMGAMFLL